MGTWEEHEQEELARQAEWLRLERAKGRGELPVKPKEKPPLLGRLKILSQMPMNWRWLRPKE